MFLSMNIPSYPFGTFDKLSRRFLNISYNEKYGNTGKAYLLQKVSQFNSLELLVPEEKF